LLHFPTAGKWRQDSTKEIRIFSDRYVKKYEDSDMLDLELDLDTHQFADDKPKFIKYESI
jgi:hypothetical protein